MAIENNQIVTIEYELRENNEVLDSNVGGAPLIFMFGKNQIIPGLEKGIAGMGVNEKSDILVPAAEAYGEYNSEALQELPSEQFAGIDLVEGMKLFGQGEDGSTVEVMVKEIKDQTVLIDYNHPLAGKDLMFSVTLLGVRDATPDEAMSGIPVENQAESGGCCGGGGGGGCGCH